MSNMMIFRQRTAPEIMKERRKTRGVREPEEFLGGIVEPSFSRSSVEDTGSFGENTRSSVEDTGSCVDDADPKLKTRVELSFSSRVQYLR